MRSALPLAAILAWVIIQVPMVLCESACGQSVDAVFLMDGHACHDEKADRHHGHCGHDCGGELPAHPEPADNDGEHVIVQIETPTGPTPVLLPPLRCAVAVGPRAEAGSDRTRTRHHRDLAWGRLDPPGTPDPVSAADRLLV